MPILFCLHRLSDSGVIRPEPINGTKEETVTGSFEQDVLDASYSAPVLVDFWAEWCGPCRMLGPVLEDLAEQANGTWRLVKLNVDEYPEVAQQYRIQGIPAVKLFHNGDVIAEFVGALGEPEVARWLEENLPSESKQTLADARQAFESGDVDRARELAEHVVEAEPANLDGRVLLSRLLFNSDPETAVDLVKDVDVGHPESGRVAAMRTLSRLQTLLESGGEDDSDGWRGYKAGIRAFWDGACDRALYAWIEMLEKGARDVDDDGARKACIAVFHWLGEDHEITQGYRRKFSSALY